jgi:hypothetical protein
VEGLKQAIVGFLGGRGAKAEGAQGQGEHEQH